MKYIKKFKDLNKNSVDIAGGKGASLGEMINSNISVPDGFVILSPTFDRFIEETDIGTEISSELSKVNKGDVNSVDNASGVIQSLILNKEVSPDITDEILRQFKSQKLELVAVRSSATAEDSSTASWAGELESCLNIAEDSLIESIKKCWASLFTPRAIFYRIEQGLSKKKVSVAVVVQKLVKSEVSGVTFTVHPVTQDKNQMIIEAGYGLGEAIVGGLITPDAYVIDKKEMKILDINISAQEKEIIRNKYKGTKEVKITGNRKEKQKLTDKQIVKLAKVCKEIEKNYKFPCDIEWALEKGKFYIVQSRPITTL